MNEIILSKSNKIKNKFTILVKTLEEKCILLELEELEMYIDNKISLFNKNTSSIIKEKISNIPKTITLQHVFSRVYAKNISIQYESDVNHVEATKLLSKRFKDARIEYQGKNNFNLHFAKRRNITSDKLLKIKKRVPIIKALHVEHFKGSTVRSSDTIMKFLEEFLVNPNNETANLLSSELKIRLSEMKIWIYSEYLLSIVFFNYLASIGLATNWDKIEIFSVDNKIEIFQEVMIDEKGKKNIRCDLIFKFHNKLFIVEYKYRYNRQNDQAEYALRCINNRNYEPIVIDHLKNYYPGLILNVDSIVLLGIGYSIVNQQIFCGIEFMEKKLYIT